MRLYRGGPSGLTRVTSLPSGNSSMLTDDTEYSNNEKNVIHPIWADFNADGIMDIHR